MDGNEILLVNETIGIIGAGVLGRTLAGTFVECGFPGERLMVSYGGKPSTFESIKEAKLVENIADNNEICQRSTIIFIAVKPQALKELKCLPFTGSSLVVSCMAGISSVLLEEILGIDVFRIMPSGPDTIRKGKGIAAVYPQNYTLTEILSVLGLKAYELQDEEMMHTFTVGVCLPAAIMVADKKGLDMDYAIEAIEKEYADFEEIYIWAKNVIPDFDSDKEEKKYIEHMCTKGGITEAIVNSLNSGDTFLDALKKALQEVEKSLLLPGSHSNFASTGEWCRDFEEYAKSQGMEIKK